jgi:hypothetical protein
MHILSLSGFPVQVPAKAGEPEYVWRYWSQAEENLQTFEQAQKMGATPLQNLEAYMEDFQFFWKPYGQVQAHPWEDVSGYLNSVSWKTSKGFTLEVASQWGEYFFFIFHPETARLRVERSLDPKFKGKTSVKWLNL